MRLKSICLLSHNLGGNECSIAHLPGRLPRKRITGRANAEGSHSLAISFFRNPPHGIRAKAFMSIGKITKEHSGLFACALRHSRFSFSSRDLTRRRLILNASLGRNDTANSKTFVLDIQEQESELLFNRSQRKGIPFPEITQITHIHPQWRASL